jgi:hypothetical protein
MTQIFSLADKAGWPIIGKGGLLSSTGPQDLGTGCPIHAALSHEWASCEARPLSLHPNTNSGAPCLASETWVFEAAQSSGAPHQRQRRALYQPGANRDPRQAFFARWGGTPQVTPYPHPRGLKARPIPADPQQVLA